MSSMLPNVNVKKGPPLHGLLHYHSGTKCPLGGVPVRKNINGGGGLYICERAGATGRHFAGRVCVCARHHYQGTWISVQWS